uniref:Uncharacterized protein n=1 Tax=Plectus sambesii TaxID=2011161 RepID=A0A914UYT5_9BILA
MTASRLSDSKLLSSTQSSSYRQQQQQESWLPPPAPLSGRGRQPDMASMVALLEENRPPATATAARPTISDEHTFRSAVASKAKSRSVDRALTPPAFYDQPDGALPRRRSSRDAQDVQDAADALSALGDELKEARAGQRTSVQVYYL